MKRRGLSTFDDHSDFQVADQQDIVLFKELSIDRMTPFNLPFEHVYSSTTTSDLKNAPSTYKQRSKEEQLEIVLNFIKEHPTRERGSIMEYSQKNNINKSQLSRYLKAYDAGQLSNCTSDSSRSATTHTIERGHPSTLMNATQIEKVLKIINNEKGDNEDISNKRIGDIIFEVIGKQPSTGYVSKFASTYLNLNGPKRKKKKKMIMILDQIETELNEESKKLETV